MSQRPDSGLIFFLDSLNQGNHFPIENSELSQQDPKSSPFYSFGGRPFAASDFATFLSMMKQTPVAIGHGFGTDYDNTFLIKQTQNVLLKLVLTNSTEAKGIVERYVHGSIADSSNLTCKIQQGS